jgi:hypothetical protein
MGNDDPCHAIVRTSADHDVRTRSNGPLHGASIRLLKHLNARALLHGKDTPPMTLWIRNILGILLLMLLTACGTVIQPTPYPPQPRRPLAELLTDLRSTDGITSINAAADLGDYGPAASPAVPDLIAMIDDARNPYGSHDLDFDDRGVVIGALYAIGPGAVAAVPTLLMIAQAPQEHVMERKAALRTLGAIGDRSVVPQLVPMLRDPDPDLTLDVGRAIARLAKLDFSEVERKNWSTENGTSAVADAALAWWDAEGQYLDWEHP